MVYSIESYLCEIGSGEDFIQYFCWSDLMDINNLRTSLEQINAHDSLKICNTAIAVAFPSGIPDKPSDYDDLIQNLEFEDEFREQRRLLSLYAEEQIGLFQALEHKLANWIKSEQNG